MLINPISDKLDIIVMAGQSNASGSGVGPCEKAYRPRADVLSFNDTDNHGNLVDEGRAEKFHIVMPREYYISIATERSALTGKIGNLSLSFADRYADEFLPEGRKAMIINAAVGGTGFSTGHWGIDDVLYVRLVRMCELALGMNPENRICAFLWHQGENDASSPSDITYDERYYSYLKNISALVSDFRGRFGTSPFISGSFTDEWTDKNKLAVKAVISAQKTLCREIDAAAFVDAGGLLSNNQQLGNGDDIHFSRNSLNILGKRYFDAFKNMTSAQK